MKRIGQWVLVGFVIVGGASAQALEQGTQGVKAQTRSQPSAASSAEVLSAEGIISQLERTAQESTLRLTTLENRVETLVLEPFTTTVWQGGKQVELDALTVWQHIEARYTERNGHQVATVITIIPIATPSAERLPDAAMSSKSKAPSTSAGHSTSSQRSTSSN